MKMQIFNIVVLQIVSLNIYVSFTHALTLFHDGGFAQEGLFSFLRIDLAAVITAELVFFMGYVNIIAYLPTNVIKKMTQNLMRPTNLNKIENTQKKNLELTFKGVEH
jgi:hypothetical protein